MKVNINDNQIGLRKHSHKLATIKNSEKPKDAKVSNCPGSSNSVATSNNVDVFTHYTDPRKAFTPLSTFKTVVYKDTALLLSNVSKSNCQHVFGQPALASTGSSQNNFNFSKSMNSHIHAFPAKPVKESTVTINVLPNKQMSSTNVLCSTSALDGVAPKTLSSRQTTSGADMEKADTTFKKLLLSNKNILNNNQKSSTVLQPSVKSSLVPKRINSLQTVNTLQVRKTSTCMLKNNQKCSTIVRRSVQSRLVSKPMNSLQTVNSAQGKKNSTSCSNLLSKKMPLNFLQPSVQSNSVTNTMNLPQTVVSVQPMKWRKMEKIQPVAKINCLNKLSNEQLLATVNPSKENSMVPSVMNSAQTVAGLQPMEEKNTKTLNDSLNNRQTTVPLCTVNPSVQNNLVPHKIKLSQTVAGSQPMEASFTANGENAVTFNDLCDNELTNVSLTIGSPSIQNSLVPYRIYLPQTAACLQPMEESNTVYDLLKNQQSSTTTRPSEQKSLIPNTMNAVQTLEDNTKQVSNVNSNNLSNIQRSSVPIPPPVSIRTNNLSKTQCLTFAQTQTSNTASTILDNNKKALHLQNSPRKVIKRKADEIENVTKNAGNSENQKNVEKKPKTKEVQIIEHVKKVNRNEQNVPVKENSNSLMCVIVEDEYPYTPPLTNVHLGIIRSVIKKRIDNVPVGSFVPKFIHSFLKNGVIYVECADNNSKQWLLHAIANYSPEQGVYLKVIPPEEINKYYPASVFVHDEDNAIEVLKRMQKQNSDVSVRNWQYVSMTIMKEKTPGITINVEIPAILINQLKQKNFKLFHAMDQVSVVMKV